MVFKRVKGTVIGAGYIAGEHGSRYSYSEDIKVEMSLSECLFRIGGNTQSVRHHFPFPPFKDQDFISPLCHCHLSFGSSK